MDVSDNTIISDVENNATIKGVCDTKQENHKTNSSSYFGRFSPSHISTTNFKLENLEYNVFLQFSNKNDQINYREYTYHQIYGPMYIIFLLFMLSMILSRNFLFVADSNPTHVSTILLFSVGFLLFIILILGRHLKFIIGAELPPKIQRVFNFIIRDILQNELESILAFCFCVKSAANLVLRVLAGQCPSDVSIAASLDCNPLALSNSPPIDSVLICFVFALYMQLFFKNVRKSVLISIWVISASAVLWSLFYFRNGTLVYILSPIFAFPLIQYECERVQMSNFLKSKCILEQEQQKRNDIIRENAEKEVIISQLNEAKLRGSGVLAGSSALVGATGNLIKRLLDELYIDKLM